jgi:Cu-processing system permease protein
MRTVRNGLWLVALAEIVAGKLAGLSVAHALAALIGFSFTGILIGAKVGGYGVGSYVTVVGFTILVGIVFISLSSMLTLLSHRAQRAYAVVLVTWFGLVLLFDLVVIGLGFLLPETWANRTAFAAVFLNPVDATRVATLLIVSGRETFGPAGAQLVRALGGTAPSVALLTATLVVWVVVPALVGAFSLRRQDV